MGSGSTSYIAPSNQWGNEWNQPQNGCVRAVHFCRLDSLVVPLPDPPRLFFVRATLR
jgi:hypothetical protein